MISNYKQYDSVRFSDYRVYLFNEVAETLNGNKLRSEQSPSNEAVESNSIIIAILLISGLLIGIIYKCLNKSQTENRGIGFGEGHLNST
jgi:hypothetical protein